MANENKTIDQLTELNDPNNNDLLIIQDTTNNITKKVKVKEFLVPYVEINSTGTLPTADGTEGIAIGAGAEARGSRNICIGFNAVIEEDEGDGINSIAIGANAYIEEASNAVQLGTGSNFSSNTFQYLNNTIANAEGLYTSYTSPQSYTPLDTDNVTSHLAAIDEAISRASGGTSTNPPTPTITTQEEGTEIDDAVTTLNFVGAGVTATNAGSGVTTVTIPAAGEAYVDINSSGTAPTATGTNSIAIGPTTRAVNGSAVALGLGAQAEGSSSIQLGSGVNRVDNSLQFRSNVIANSHGIEAPVVTGTNSQTPRSGSLYIDDTNGSERICVYVNGSWKCANLT